MGLPRYTWPPRISVEGLEYVYTPYALPRRCEEDIEDLGLVESAARARFARSRCNSNDKPGEEVDMTCIHFAGNLCRYPRVYMTLLVSASLHMCTATTY